MLNIKFINAFEDNYIFLLRCENTNEIAVVDPGDADVVIKSLEGRELTKILITHHHTDHIGGVEKLVHKYGCEVIAFASDKYRIPCVTRTVAEGDFVTVGETQGQVLEVFGHTSGHIAYYFDTDKSIFCGDTLFVGGCGRLFEGTPELMFNSLVKLKSLPDDTQIFCAHEYTVNNLQFAGQVMPDDVEIKEALLLAKNMRMAGERTVPSSIGAEKCHNVFLKAETVQEFGRLRALKDSF